MNTDPRSYLVGLLGRVYSGCANFALSAPLRSVALLSRESGSERHLSTSRHASHPHA
jgi:hypothetical protein